MGRPADVLRVAAAVEAASEHPLAAAIVEVSDCQALPGRVAAVSTSGQGSPRFIESQSWGLAAYQPRRISRERREHGGGGGREDFGTGGDG